MHSEKMILLALVSALVVIGIGGAHGNIPEVFKSSCLENGIKRCNDVAPSQYYSGEPFQVETLCSAAWGGFPRLNNATSEMIVHHLNTSIQYLLISSNFKYWKRERPGFANYFSKLSDQHWEEAMALLIHFAERGGKIAEDSFKISINGTNKAETGTFHTTELEALSHALDLEKWLAQKTLHLAHDAIHSKPHKEGEIPTSPAHDLEFADFLADKLQKNSVLRIKHLANYVGLLGRIMREDNSNYALFKFDSEYLK